MDNEIFEEIRHFLNDDSKLIKIPRKRRKLIISLIYLANKFEEKRIYNEKEINDILKEWHTFNDWATLRRLLYNKGFFERDKFCATYKLSHSLPSLDDFQSWIIGIN